MIEGINTSCGGRAPLLTTSHHTNERETLLSDSVITGTDTRIIIYACGLLISVPFLLLTISAYMLTPRLRDVHGKALCNYCGCLSLAFTALAIVQLARSDMLPEICVSIGKRLSTRDKRTEEMVVVQITRGNLRSTMRWTTEITARVLSFSATFSAMTHDTRR